ncbi:MAG: GrpB family protein [Caulobacter sp.]|nr:GrpB family protein [Caulobacter sp.]
MDEIEIVPSDPSWPARFEEEAARLLAILPADLLIDLEHIGSTAVPGLPAKPIIDILATVTDLEAAKARSIGPLEAAGYAFWIENPDTDRLFFVKGLPPSAPRRTHHLHIMEAGPGALKHIAFCDYLRDHPGEAKRYADLKQDLARRHRTDREAYTAAKSAYIEDVLELAVAAATPAPATP